MFLVYIPCEKAKLTCMAKFTKCIHLRGNCQLHSGFPYDIKTLISVSDET